MQVDIPAARVVFSRADGRIPLCLTCPKTLNTFLGMLFVLVPLFGGLYFVHGSEPPFGEGFLQTALLIVSFHSHSVGLAPVLYWLPGQILPFFLFFLCTEYSQLYEGLNFA